MIEVQSALDAQKEEFQKREDSMQLREQEMKTKENELQESLIKFNRFLHVSKIKRDLFG